MNYHNLITKICSKINPYKNIDNHLRDRIIPNINIKTKILRQKFLAVLFLIQKNIHLLQPFRHHFRPVVAVGIK